MGVDFQKEIKDEDRLEDLDRGDGAGEAEEEPATTEAQ